MSETQAEYSEDNNNERIIYADDLCELVCVDAPGPGGACHEYIIRGPDRDDGKDREIFAEVSFQYGALKEEGTRPGASDLALIYIAIDRIYHFQNGQFPCRENELTLTKLEEAMHWQCHRLVNRQSRGVEGKDEA